MSISTAAALAVTGASTAADRGSGFGDFFRYHGWLSPGIRLFRCIGFPAKAAWISTAFVLPLVVMLVLLANGSMQQVSSTQSERAGVEYARTLLLLEKVVQFRRSAAGFPDVDLAEHQQRVKAAFEAVQAQQETHGKAWGLDEAYAELLKFHEAILQQPRRANPVATFEAHVEYTQAIAALMSAVADGSQLALDPDLDTHHLMNVAVLRGPRFAESTARIRGISVTALAAKETQQLSPASRDLLRGWLSTATLQTMSRTHSNVRWRQRLKWPRWSTSNVSTN